MSKRIEVEIFTPTEFLDHIASSPRAARELIERLPSLKNPRTVKFLPRRTSWLVSQMPPLLFTTLPPVLGPLSRGLGAVKYLSDGQGETPNSFSMSAIIGCVRPALRNSAKSSAMTRSHSLASCPERGLPL